MKYKTITLNIYLILGLFCLPFMAFSNSLTVNVDNPSFRKLVVAIPEFSKESTALSTGVSSDLHSRGHSELSELLTFSGYFNVIARAAYGDLVTKLVAERQSKGGNAWLDSMTELSGPEAKQWRALKVESVTLGSITAKGQEAVLTLKTFDVTQRKEILAKQFTGMADYKDAIRKYADFLLEAYTGKSGIFSSKLAFVGRRKKGDPKQIYISDFDGSNLHLNYSYQTGVCLFVRAHRDLLIPAV